MNYVDFTILLIAVVGFLYGLIKGVIRQVGSLGGFIAGIVVSRFFGNSFSALLREMFDLPEGVSRVIAYSLLFLIVYIICVQLMRLIHHITHHVALGWLDRLAGALFGAVKSFRWHKSSSFRKPNRRGDCLYLIRYATSRISVVKIVKQIKNETG